MVKQSNILEEGKVRYFCNAILYILWLSEVKQGKMTKTFVFVIFNSLVRFFGTKSFYEKMIARQQESEKDLGRIFYDRKFSVHMAALDRKVSFIYGGYCSLVILPLIGVYIRYFYAKFSVWIMLLIIVLVLMQVFIFVDKNTRAKDTYLKYFQHFDKEDNRWLQKWKVITFVFCLGSVLSLILSIIFGHTIFM